MIGERITGIREKIRMRNMSRITTCSIALNHLPALKAGVLKQDNLVE